MLQPWSIRSPMVDIVMEVIAVGRMPGGDEAVERPKKRPRSLWCGAFASAPRPRRVFRLRSRFRPL
jgi:hypothetical protein